MMIRVSFLLALLIFFTSATAVSLNSFRLSDISSLLLLFVLLIDSGSLGKRLKIFLVSFCVLVITSLSFLHQMISADYSIVLAGMPNALAIFFNLVIMIIFILRCNEELVVSIMIDYCRITLLICFSLYLLTVMHGAPGWIDQVDVIERFSALSKNPNQLALFLLPIPFFSIYAYHKNRITKSVAILMISFVIFLNIIAMGKALFVAWILSVGFFYLIRWRLFDRIKITLIFLVSRFFVILLFLLVASPFIYLLYTGATPGGQEDQGAIRLALWENGLNAWLDAFFIGHGPGHYSGVDRPYEFMESHNFIIDWASAYGIVGVAFLLLFFYTILAQVLKSSNKLILVFLIALIVQMTFHFYARQPIFWLWWIFAFIVTNNEGLIKVRANFKIA